MNIDLKKYLIFILYILLNICLIGILFLLDNGYLIIGVVLILTHFNDFFGVIYQLFQFDKVVLQKQKIRIKEKINVCALIPTYAEDYRLVKKNIDSLVEQKISKSVKITLVIICDGLKIKAPNEEPLFNCLDKEITYTNDIIYKKEYKHWKNGEKVLINYKVGQYKDHPVVLCYKPKNLGKKDSLIIGEKLINHLSEKMDFLYHTDSDTITDKYAIDQLLRYFLADPKLDGVSGMLRAYYSEEDHKEDWFGKRWLNKSFYMMQDFQYYFSLIVRRQTQSLINKTECLPGACNMIKLNDKSKKAIKKYARVPLKTTNFIQSVTRLQGTDRRYTTLLLKQGANLQMNWRAVGYTEPPLDPSSFIKQRRRWSSNAFFNSIVLLYTEGIPLYTKVSALLNILKLYTTLLRFTSYITYFILLKDYKPAAMTLFGIFILFPYIYILFWIIFAVPRGDKLKMLLGFIFNKIYQPILSTIVITKMFYTSTNFSWTTLKANPVDSDSRTNTDSSSNFEVEIVVK